MMSIRFRLTLLYNAILALVLTLFSISLYSIQSHSTMEQLKQDLEQTGENLKALTLKVMLRQDPDLKAVSVPQEPRTFVFFSFFSKQVYFYELPEFEIIRILDPDGVPMEGPYGILEDALPISVEGLRAVQNQNEWFESINLDEKNLLVYSRPVIVDGEVASILQVARPLDEREASLGNLAGTLLSASLITLATAFVIGWLFSGFAFWPIRRLTQTAEAIGQERDFSQRVEYRGPQDEVGRLAATLNAMLARLHDAYRRIATSLERQRRFVVDVSHELRTPLTTLRGNLDLLRRDPPIPAEERDDILADLIDESDRLIRLVNELLLLAHADVRRKVESEPLPIKPLLMESCRQAQCLDPERTISLDAEDFWMSADRDALKQVLLILLDNALKHSTNDIEVTARKVGDSAEIRIRDHGSGISPEQMKHVFDRFYRGEVGKTVPGFSLGLSIAKSLVEGQGGTIRIESVVGEGCTVILSFPMARR
jgi:two-component system OmpR family sensor kinase